MMCIMVVENIDETEEEKINPIDYATFDEFCNERDCIQCPFFGMVNIWNFNCKEHFEKITA